MSSFDSVVNAMLLTPVVDGVEPVQMRTVRTEHGPRTVTLRLVTGGKKPEIFAAVSEVRDGVKHTMTIQSGSLVLLERFIVLQLQQKEIR